MTYTRLSDEYLDCLSILSLTPEAFRAYFKSLAWAVDRNTGGQITSADVPLIPVLSHAHIAALVASGVWEETAESWTIVGYADIQLIGAGHDEAARSTSGRRDDYLVRGLSEGATDGSQHAAFEARRRGEK